MRNGLSSDELADYWLGYYQGRGKAKQDLGTEADTPKAPAVDRSQCRETVCYCHDDSSWTPGAYPDGCSWCGCRWAE